MLNVLVFKTLKAINQICIFGIIYFDYSMAAFLVYYRCFFANTAFQHWSSESAGMYCHVLNCSQHPIKNTSVLSQKILSFILATVRTWNLTHFNIICTSPVVYFHSGLIHVPIASCYRTLLSHWNPSNPLTWYFLRPILILSSPMHKSPNWLLPSYFPSTIYYGWWMKGSCAISTNGDELVLLQN
jgi:hypothetical protein